MKKKSLALLLSLVLVIGVVAGSSLAWLTAKDDPVVNVFTPSDINITLTESDTDPDTDGDQHNYKMVPGDTLAKDPKVKVESGSEACWLFIKVEEVEGDITYTVDGVQNTTTWDDFLTYTVDSGWTALDSNNATRQEGIYYRSIDAEIAKEGSKEPYSILTNDQVEVKATVTKEMMKAIFDDTAKQPKLTFSAYAIQSANLADQNGDGTVDASDAWALIEKPVTP